MSINQKEREVIVISDDESETSSEDLPDVKDLTTFLPHNRHVSFTNKTSRNIQKRLN
jgi:hypothetical protein